MAYIQFDTSALTVDANSTQAFISIETDDVSELIVDYIDQPEDAWITSYDLVEDGGGGMYMLEIEYEQNTTGALRAVEIGFYGTLASDPTQAITETATFTQQNGSYIAFPGDVILECGVDMTSITLDTNCSSVGVSFDSSAQWLEISPTSGLIDGDAISISSQYANTSGVMEAASVDLIGNDGTLTEFTVYQKYQPNLTTTDTLPVSALGGRFTYRLYTLNDFSLANIPNWIVVRDSRENIITEGTKIRKPSGAYATLYLDYAANAGEPRIASAFAINYYTDGGVSPYGSILIPNRQLGDIAPADYITASPSALTMQYTANWSNWFTIDTNVVSVSAAASNGFVVSPRSGPCGTEFQVDNTFKNTTGADYTGSILLSGGSATTTVPITQYSTPSISQFGGSSTVQATGGTLMFSVHSHYRYAFFNVPSWVHLYNGQDPSETYVEGQILPQTYGATQDYAYVFATVDPNISTSQRDSGDMTMQFYSWTGQLDYSDATPITFTQLGAAQEPGRIIISPSSRTVGASGGNVNFSLTYDSIDMSSVTASTGTLSSDKATLIVNVPTAQAPTTMSVVVSGDDLIGNALSATATISQYGPSYIRFNPTALDVAFNATSASVSVEAYQATGLAVSSFTGTAITNVSLNGATLTLSLSQNTTTSSRSGSVVVSGIDQLGATISATLPVTQNAQPAAPGTIVVSPTATSVPRTGGTVVCSVTYSNMLMSSVTCSQGTFNNDKSQLTIEIGPNVNPMREDMTHYIEIEGDDLNGDRVYADVSIFQPGRDATLYINPPEVLLDANESTATYQIATYGLGEISVSFSGDTSIVSSYTLANDTLNVVTENNTSNSQKSVTITLSGQVTGGSTTLTATATLTKRGAAEGYIVVSPRYAYIEKSGGSVTFDISTSNIPSSTLTATTTLGTVSFNNDKTALTLTLSQNTAHSSKSVSVVINGVDTGGTPRSATATVTQYGVAPYLRLAPSTQTLPYTPGTATYTFDSYRVTGISATFSGSVVVTGYYIVAGTLYVDTATNTTGSTQTSTITLTGVSDTGVVVTATATLRKNAMSGDVSVNPVWKDVVLTSTASNFIEYHIGLGSEVIYAGKAYRYPGASNISWTVNDVVSDYLGNGISFVDGIQQIPDYAKEFVIGTNTGASWNQVYYNSWAYKDTNYALSEPIDYRVDPRQWLPVSILTRQYNSVTLGSRSYTSLSWNKGYTVMMNLRNLTVDCSSGIPFVGADGTRWTYRPSCGEYAIYYANAYGGWDSLLVNGTSMKTDNVDHLMYRKKAAAASLSFSKTNYQNNITRQWTLKTPLYFGNEGSRMHHLVETTQAYLHILSTNEIIPIVVTTTQCDELNYTNNGKKPYMYEIVVEESHNKIRK